MEQTLLVRSKDHTYPVIIGKNILHFVPKVVGELQKKVSKICIIVDEKVATIHEEKLFSLKNLLTDFQPIIFRTKSGEKAKSFQSYYDAITFCINQGLDRNSLLIAFGGGAIGDLTGFVAATLFRGVRFMQLPTTILAHDSAVGGKTGINHERGKNLIGAFHQPTAVIFDEQFFETLPIREIRSGFAEIVKASFISHQPFFEEILQTIQNEEDLKKNSLHSYLMRAIETKIDIVEKDPYEQNIRAFLNFGHTLGHAIEAELGFGKISHGEAVMFGMLFAIQLSKKFERLTFPLQNFIQWAKTIGYPIGILTELNEQQLLLRIKHDKKAKFNQCQFVLLKDIGKPALITIEDTKIMSELKEFLKLVRNN